MKYGDVFRCIKEKDTFLKLDNWLFQNEEEENTG